MNAPDVGSFICLTRSLRKLRTPRVCGLLVGWTGPDADQLRIDLIGTARILCSDGCVYEFYVHTKDSLEIIC